MLAREGRAAFAAGGLRLPQHARQARSGRLRRGRYFLALRLAAARASEAVWDVPSWPIRRRCADCDACRARASPNITPIDGELPRSCPAAEPASWPAKLAIEAAWQRRPISRSGAGVGGDADPFGGTTAADRARNFARARRHTRIVRALRLSLPGAAAGVVVLYFVMIIDTTGWVGGFPKLEMPRIIPDNLTMDNPSYEGFNKDGGKYVVRAKTAIQDLVNTEFVRLNDITGDMTDANKSKTNLTAAKGEFNTKTNQLELTGGIDIVADSGLKAKLSTRHRSSPTTTSSPPRSRCSSRCRPGTIRSNEMRILSKSREIAFVDDVKAHLVPREAGCGKPRRGRQRQEAGDAHVRRRRRADRHHRQSPRRRRYRQDRDLHRQRQGARRAMPPWRPRRSRCSTRAATPALPDRAGCDDSGRRHQDQAHLLQIAGRHDARAAGSRHRAELRLRRRQPGGGGQRRCRDDLRRRPAARRATRRPSISRPTPSC